MAFGLMYMDIAYDISGTSSWWQSIDRMLLSSHYYVAVVAWVKSNIQEVNSVTVRFRLFLLLLLLTSRRNKYIIAQDIAIWKVWKVWIRRIRVVCGGIMWENGWVRVQRTHLVYEIILLMPFFGLNCGHVYDTRPFQVQTRRAYDEMSNWKFEMIFNSKRVLLRKRPFFSRSTTITE